MLVFQNLNLSAARILRMLPNEAPIIARPKLVSNTAPYICPAAGSSLSAI